MKKFIVLFLIFASAGWWAGNKMLIDNRSNNKSEFNEERENPEARVFYEWRLLRDPATNKIPENIRRKELAYSKKLPKLKDVQLSKTGSIAGTYSWSSAGPYNIGGRTRALALDISDNTYKTIIAGGASGGLWRSTNGGDNWVQTTQPGQLHSVTCVAQDLRAGHQKVFYAGTGEKSGNSASASGAPYLGDGIFKSTDGGQSWTLLPSTVSGTPQTWDSDFDYIWNVAVDPSNSAQDVVYAAVYGGIKRSTDGGNTWESVLGDYMAGEYASITVTSTGTVYAAISSDASQDPGIWKSITGEAGSWENITPNDMPVNYGRIAIGAAPSNENIIYFLAVTPNSGVNGHSLWKYTSTDTNPWENRSNSIPNDYDSQGGYDLLVSVKPDNADVVFIGGTSLYRSNNGFADANQIAHIGGYGNSPNGDYPGHFPDQHIVVFDPSSPAVMYSGNDGGVFRTDNNMAQVVSWTNLDNGYVTTQFYNVAIDMATAGSDYITGGMQDRGDFFNNSPKTFLNWLEMDTQGVDGTFHQIANGAAYFYFSGQSGFLARANFSPEGIKSNEDYIAPDNASVKLFVNPYALDPNNSEIMYFIGGPSLFRTTQASTVTSSNGWTEMAATRQTGDLITAVSVSKTPENRVYFGNSSGGVFRVDNANTGNPVPVDISSGKNLPNGYVINIAVDQTDGNKAILVFSNYSIISLYSTTDGGSSWTPVSGNLEENPDGSGSGPSCRWAAMVHDHDTTRYFTATSTGLYSTLKLDGMNTVWMQEGASSIGNVVCTTVLARQIDGRVVLATHGNGVYKTDVTVPVELIDFTAAVNNNSVDLKWITATELNNKGFDIERNTGSAWEKIAFVPGHGTSSGRKDYHYTDETNIPPFSGNISYRLKQIDLNGTAVYSKVINVNIDLLPETFSLNQNYPNPFNPSTTIGYVLPVDGKVKLTIFNPLGEKIAELVNKVETSGVHRVNWNAGNHPSGNYVYSIEVTPTSGGRIFRESKKMILLK